MLYGVELVINISILSMTIKQNTMIEHIGTAFVRWLEETQHMSYANEPHPTKLICEA